MDNNEAKFILSAYRPSGQDASDARFSDALAQARRDPMLEQWFRAAVAFDAAIARNLAATPVPADLRENILAGAKVTRPVRWTKPLVTWAIAASLAIAAIVGAVVLRQTTRPILAGWQTNALSVISSVIRGESRFDFQAHSATELIGWLTANHAPTAQEIPQKLVGLQSLGCKTFSWNGIPASVICFMREDGGLVHLVVASPSKQTRTGTARDPYIATQGHWTTATWQTGDTVYMVALEGSREQLRSYFL